MTVATGTTLGPYEIGARIGEGGMGEVWRATDTRLRRAVAIKVLPAAFAADRERLLRFEREAQLLAQLHHPNIAGIFGIEDLDGRPALVMELVEGEDLSATIARGPLPVDDALRIARQIAEALEAAHEQGIVHRDLKPGNVKVRADGTVKVLDFGLAKAMEAGGGAEPAVDLAHSPTLLSAAPGTQMGVILGTAGYMSPEQARGRPVDKRADIWAFGVVLLEMLTGKRLFAGETVSDTLAAVLRQEIGGRELPAATPPEVRRLLARLLERDPKNRLHDIADARLVLQDALSGASDPLAAETTPAPPARRWPWLALATLVLLAVGWLVGRVGERPGPVAGLAAGSAPRPVSFQQLTDAAGVESAPSLSPDGKTVVYVARIGPRTKLFLQRVGGHNATPLDPGTDADDWQPAFSPDGDQIAFRSERDGGGIFVMGSTGESVRRLTGSGYNPSWSPDGKEIAVANGTYLFPTDRGGKVRGLFAAAVDTGKTRVISEAADVMQPSWSPDGKRIAFWGLRGDSGQRDLFTVAADGSETKREGVDVTNDGALDCSPTWSPDGKWLWFASNRGGAMNLWRVPIDEATGKVLGAPEPTTTPSLWSGELSFSRDGSKLAYSSLIWRSTLLRAPFDSQQERIAGPPLPILKSTQPIRDHSVSPDGQSITFMQTTSHEDIAIARIDGTGYRLLTDDNFRDRGPVWTPDGKEIAFYSDRTGKYEIWAIRPDGSGLHQLVRSPGAANFPVFAPDGTRVAFAVLSSKVFGIAMADLRGPAPVEGKMLPPPDLGGGLVFWPLSWSRDGRRVIGSASMRDGTLRGIVVYDVEGGSARIVYRATEDPYWKLPVWLADGRRALVRDRRGISLLDTETGKQHLLLEVGGYFVGRSADISPDQKWITYTETATEGDVWVAELK